MALWETAPGGLTLHVFGRKNATMSDSELVMPGFLETLIIMAQRGGEIGVSLFVGGAWISGNITTERKFLDNATSEIGEAVSKATGGEVNAKSLRRSVFKHLLEDAEEAETANPMSMSGFIYLTDVQTKREDAVSISPTAIMRVTIASIDAVMAGRLIP